MNYANRQPAPKRIRTRRSVQTGVRIPADLIAPMDARCRSIGVRRSALIVAALRVHLNAPDPVLAPSTAEKIKGQPR